MPVPLMLLGTVVSLDGQTTYAHSNYFKIYMRN